MKSNILHVTALLSLALCLLAGNAQAQNGQPHSLKADASFTDVTLTWQKPTADLTLQWHDGDDYNGQDGQLTNPEGTAQVFTASKFTADELKDFVGQTVESIDYWEYREVLNVWVLIYENGKVAYEQKVDNSNFKKNSWRPTTLTTPYVIPADKEVMFVIKQEYGRNNNFIGICDRAATKNKGNLYSFDGKTWYNDGPGDFLITAHLRNTATAEPEGYNVYRDGAKVNDVMLTDATSYVLKGEAEGTHKYKVSALYGTDEKMSAEVTATSISVYSSLPTVNGLTGSVDGLKGTLTWGAPLKRGSEMTWSNKTFNQAIGGTASSNTKVWIKQEFDANDMAAFPNHRINAINAYVGPEGGILTVTAFIIKNGVIDYYEVIPAETVTAITAGAWNKFTLTTPYNMELGNTYAFGLYYTQTPKMHPAGVDTSTATSAKGNSFSTSSPNSTDFAKSKPSWKTLASGKIAGNFMLTADVEALSTEAGQPQEITAYDVYRDGAKIAENLTALTYEDNVTDLGTYTYSVVAKSADAKTSPATSTDVTYTLPAEYVAPTIIDYDQKGKDISFSWSTSAYELKHYGTASYMAGFTEEMTILYGTKFSKEELTDYVGYKFNSVKFGIGANIGAFKLQLIDSDKNVLFSKDIAEGEIEPGYLYNMTLGEDAVAIPADKDLYLVYNATLPANTNALLLDAGPAVDGGAMVSLTNGANWLKLGTIAPDYNDYNIVIGAVIVAPAPAQGAAKTDAGITLGKISQNFSNIRSLNADVIKTATEEPFGVAPSAVLKAPARAAADKPQVKSFKIYRNNELIKEVTEAEYTETLSEYGVFQYYVTSVYTNGWESAASRVLTFTNIIAQKAQAPYDLTGNATGKDLTLTWSAPDAAPELKYHTGDQSMALGMTVSGTTCEGYHAIMFPAAEIADKAGQEVSHIKFGLNENTLKTASVFVMYNYNIVYEQEVDVADLVVGMNTVRLNNPVKVEAGKDLFVGYHITYAKGGHPLLLDAGPAVAGYGDIISSSGSQGYWYSLATKYKQNYNYRMSAVLKKADVEMAPANGAALAEETTTYNVYLDGVAVQTGVTTTTCTLPDAASGSYTVTAVTADGESAESNAVKYTATSGMTNVIDDANAADATIYSIDGRLVGKDDKNLKKGVYIKNGKKFVVK